MIQGFIIDPLRQIKTDDLKIIGARIREGSELHRGQIATIEVAFSLSRSVESLAVRLRIYDTEGRCAHASRLDTQGAFAQGDHCVNFLFIANLSVGEYVASFEFIDENIEKSEINSFEKILGLHNSFVEFLILKSSDDIDVGINVDDSVLGYAELFSAVSVRSGSPGDFEKFRVLAANPVFPWPLVKKNIDWLELRSVLDNLFPPAGKAHTTPPTLLSPDSYDCEFLAGMLPMRTQVGVSAGFGVRSNGAPGVLLYGPYISILPGRYSVVFKGKIVAEANDRVVFEVTAKRGRVVLVRFLNKLPIDGILNISLDFEVVPPGLRDLEFRVAVGGSADLLVESVVVRSKTDLVDRSAYKIEHLLSNYFERTKEESGFKKLNQIQISGGDNKNALVFIPNRVFTICGLLVARYLSVKSNYRIILVSEGDFLEEINSDIKRTCGIDRCVLLRNLNEELPDLKVDCVVTHAENSFHQTVHVFKELARRNLNPVLQVYGDGFRNYVNIEKITAFRDVSKIYFFGVDHFLRNFDAEIPVEVIDFSVTQKIIARFAQAHNLRRVEGSDKYSKYSVFCLRYWGLHGYNFPAEAVAECWYATISHHVPKDELIIFKGGGGHIVNNDSVVILKNILHERGYQFIDAYDYIVSCGMERSVADNSLEYLLFFGFFARATRFFTLDSSLPTIISHLDYISRPVEIIAGAKRVDVLKKYAGFGAVKLNMRQLRYVFNNSKYFDPYEVCDDEEGDHIRIRLL